MDTVYRHWLRGRWIIGGALIIIGVFFLLMNVGIVERFPIWKFWPIILIALGINKVVQPFHRAEGFWLMAIGVWLQVSFLRLWELGFLDTWPAVLIALGIFWMWESLEKDSRKRKIAEQMHGTETFSPLS